jgi:glucose/mannose-6-phosphate isomerase
LKDLTSEKGFKLIPLAEGFQPRAALPNQFFSIASILKGLGLIGSLWGEVEELHRVLSLQKKKLSSKTPTDSNPAKKLALDVKGTIPFIYGSPLLEGVCYRLSTQLNENSKTPSGYGSFPEAFHNAIMFREGENYVTDKISIILIRDPLDSEAIKRKIDGFERLMEGYVGRIVSIDAKGRGKLTRIMSALYTGDYFSTYLGLLYGLDPSSTKSIKMLKKWK